MRIALLVVGLVALPSIGALNATWVATPAPYATQDVPGFFRMMRSRVAAIVAAPSLSRHDHRTAAELRALASAVLPEYVGLWRSSSGVDAALDSLLRAQRAEARLEYRRLAALRTVLGRLRRAHPSHGP